MDAKGVNSTDDLMAAADAQLHAPIEPITKKVAPVLPREELSSEAESTSDPRSEEAAESVDGGERAESSARSAFEVDGESFTPEQIRQMKKDAQLVKDADQARKAAEYLLQHPEEYERVRRERGMQSPESAPKPPEQPATPKGPDPVDQPQAWKYARFEQYVRELNRQGKQATSEQIAEAVEQDHVHARTDRMHEILVEERHQRAEEAKRVDKERAQWREEQEAASIARQLGPLFQKYPEAATAAGQEEVEARILRAVHLGQPVDYERIVQTVHNRSMDAVKSYSQRKRAMGESMAPASGRGGAAQGSRPKLSERLPADVSSIMEYASRAERGEQ